MIDLHVHPLPALDDGPPTMEEAVRLVDAAAAAGTTTLVATPHIDYRWGLDAARIEAAVAELAKRLRQERIDVVLLSGAEIAFPRLLELSAEELDALRLGAGPYALVESPHTTAMGDFDSVLLDRLRAGERMLLAHPELCPSFQRDPTRLRRLIDAGALTSVTARSLTGDFGRRVRDFTIDLLEGGLVHSVASDAHDTIRRPPGLGDAFDRLQGELSGIAALADWLTLAVPRAILDGSEIPARPVEVGRRRHRSRPMLAWLRRGRPRRERSA